MKKIIRIVVLSLGLILVACNESSSSASSSSAMKNAIPEYTGAGSVTVDADDDWTYNASYGGVPQDDFAAYLVQIKASGWKLDENYSVQGLTYSYVFYKDESTLYFSVMYYIGSSTMEIEVYDEADW